MPTLLVLGAGAFQLPVLHAARRRGLHLVVVDRNVAAPGMALAESAYSIDPADTEAVTTLAFQEDIDGVLALCDDGVRTAAAVCKALRLPGLDPSAATRASHRGMLLDTLARRVVPVVRHQRVFDLDAAREAAQELGLPVRLVPVDVSHRSSARRVDSFDQLEAAYTQARSTSRGATELLVEEMLEGPELGVETLSTITQHHVIAMSDRIEAGSTAAPALGHVTPSRLPRVALTQARVVTLAALDALSATSTAAHVTLRIGRLGPVVVDVELRLGGNLVATELVPRATGVDLGEAAIDLALAGEPKIRATRYEAAAERSVRIQPGVVTAVTSIDSVRRCPGVAAAQLAVMTGDRVVAGASGTALGGWVIAIGPDPSVAQQRAEAAAGMMRIEVAPEGTAGGG